MPRIFFKKQFVPSILDGSKTTTVRCWKLCNIAPGDRVFSPSVGWLRINSCDRIELDDLKEADAKADGFASLKELHRVLRRLYPTSATAGRQWYRIAFVLEKSSVEKSPASPKPVRTQRRPKTPREGSAKQRLAAQIRLELDKAVRASGSLLPL